MKIKSYILLVTLYLFSFNVSAQEKEVTSAIREVTVFFQGAQVSRTSADFSLTKGQTVVVFKGLEQAIMENSIRAGVKGNARILNIMKSTDFLDQQQSNAKIEQLKKELDGIDREIELENAHARVYGQEKDLLLANMKLGGVNNGVETAQIREAAAFYRLKLTEIEEGQLAIKDKIKTLGEKRKNILAQLNELNYQKNMPSGRIEITVEADAAGTYGILLSYLVTTASWYPSYDIRIEEVGDAVNIIRKANLTQSTGLDWNNVTLGFSTGNPMEQQQLPELYPWYARVYQESYRVKSMKPMARKTESMAVPMAAVADDAEEMVELSEYAITGSAMPEYQMNLSANSIYEFVLQTKTSVVSDGKSHSFSIGAAELTADYHYQSVPKKDKAAYLMATIKNWEEYELVEGAANIYYENMYVGETYLSTAQVLDSMQLSLGKDKGIVIERKPVKDFTRTRTIGANTKKSFGYEISVRNSKKAEINLIIEDQIPVSTDSQIIIEADELSKGKLTPASGKVTWDIPVKPGETVRIPFSFSVKYPKDLNISL